jgi:DNA-binding GntR family transcriptional regulator
MSRPSSKLVDRLAEPAKSRSAAAGAPGHDPGANLTRIAYEKISSAIVFGRLDLGEPLSEADLSKALGMSKSPVRNAINELKVHGLVEIIPQSGTYVFSPTREMIIELSEFRFLLEEQALRLSMERNREALLADLQRIIEAMTRAWSTSNTMEIKRLDTAYHHSFIDHSQNSYLITAYADISPLVEALRYRFMDTVSYRNKASEEHHKMLSLLAAGRLAKATAMLRDHIRRTREFQAAASWSSGRSQRKFYRSRDYSNILRTEGELSAV